MQGKVVQFAGYSKQIEQKQLSELQLSDLSPELKEKIAQEYKRLCTKHPGWRKHRAMRKAGEAFNVAFQFSQEAENPTKK